MSGARFLLISLPLQSSDWRPLDWESELPACLTWTGPAFPGALWAGRLSWSPRSWGAEPKGHAPGPTPPPAPSLAQPLAAEPGGVAELGLGAPAVAAQESLCLCPGAAARWPGWLGCAWVPAPAPAPAMGNSHHKRKAPSGPRTRSFWRFGRSAKRPAGRGRGGGGAGGEEGLPAAAAATTAAPSRGLAGVSVGDRVFPA